MLPDLIKEKARTLYPESLVVDEVGELQDRNSNARQAYIDGCFMTLKHIKPLLVESKEGLVRNEDLEWIISCDSL